jgi:hypothetical protein
MEEDIKYIRESLDKLLHYIEKENFRGYDPYDTLNSVFPFSKFGRTFSILALQIQKKNPFNIRPFLSINKETNNMGLGLMLKAYCQLQKNFPERDYLAQAGLIYELLKQGRSKNYKHACWGYNFDWPTAKKNIPKNSPNAVVTSFVCAGLWEYYSLHKKKETQELIESAGKFILEDLKTTEDRSGICFSYTPIEADCCYNASLLSAQVLAMVYSFTKEKRLLEKVESAVSYVIDKQHDDGHWNYSLDKNTGKERDQIDFHQGFILDCLRNIKTITEHDFPGADASVKKGVEYYYKEQFLTNGRALWRVPKSFPVDIHNQSQGMITFTGLAGMNDGYAPFALTIAKWTIRNMQDEKGFFYYRVYPLYKIRISYMRWAQANMLCALSQLLIHSKKA